MHVFTTSRTASTPRRCPPTRGRKRFFAQRPLPSMMIATWRGTWPVSGIAVVALVNSVIGRRCLDGHQFLFDLDHGLVGHLLHLVLGALLLVLAHVALLEQPLQVRDRVAADVAHRHLGV